MQILDVDSQAASRHPRRHATAPAGTQTCTRWVRPGGRPVLNIGRMAPGGHSYYLV